MEIALLLLLLFPYTFSTQLIEQSASIANTVFKEFLTSLVWMYDEGDDVVEFIKLYEGSIIVARIQDECDNENIRQFYKDKRLTQTIFFAAEITEVEYFLKILYKDLMIPIHLIVVLTKSVSNSELTKLLETAWNNDVADILIISSNDKNVTLSTSFPFRNGKCNDFNPVHLHPHTKELFPRKFKNFHGCGIRTSLLQMSPYSRVKLENDTFQSLTGIDGCVLNILFEILNASMDVISAKDHGGGLGTIENGTATGSFGDLVYKRADILVPGLIMNIRRFSYVQFAHPHQVINLYWFGPRRRQLSDWKRILQPLMSHMTPALCVIAVLFIGVTMMVRKFGHNAYSNDSVLLLAFTMFLGMEVKIGSKSHIIMFLFMLWIWFCLVVRIAYQGVLVNRLQMIALEDPLETFHTSVKLVDGYGGMETLHDYFKGTKYYDDYQVVHFVNVTKYLKAIEAGQRFLIATDLYIGLDAAPNIQVLYKDPVTTGPGVCFSMRPGWPAVPEFDDLIIRIIESGFVQKIYNEYFLELDKATETDDGREAKPLTLQSLIGCFYILIVMYSVCIVVLCIEIFHRKMKVHGLNKNRIFLK